MNNTREIKLSESQKQLLRTMLFYELQNYVILELDRLKSEGKDAVQLEIVRAYLENRIQELAK